MIHVHFFKMSLCSCLIFAIQQNVLRYFGCFSVTETRMTALGIIHMKKKSQPPSEQPEEETPAFKKAKTDETL